MVTVSTNSNNDVTSLREVGFRNHHLPLHVYYKEYLNVIIVYTIW